MIRKLVRQMLAAQVVSALTVSLCLLIDSIMIGRFLGEDAIAAYGLANPLLLAIGAIGSLLAAGIQVVCSRSLGRGSQEETNAGFSSALAVAAGISIVFMTVALVFRSFFAGALGAEAGTELFGQTRDYLAGFSLGAPGSMGALVLVPFMQMAGESGLLIVAVLTMTVTDIAFDLLNVFVFHGGMFGMGLASALSYYAAMIVSAFYFLSHKCVFRFSLKGVTFKKVCELFSSGVPAGFGMAASMICIFSINRILMATGGSNALAAFTVICSIGNAACCISTGIGSVSLTLSGILFHEEDRNGLRELIRLLCRYSVYLGLEMGIILLAFAPVFVGLFIREAGTTQKMAVLGLRIYAAGLIPACINYTLKNMYQATGRTVLIEVISLVEGAVLPVLAALALSGIAGVTGVWLQYFIGELLTLVCIGLFVRWRCGLVPWKNGACLYLKKGFGVAENDLMEADIHDLPGVTAVSEKAAQFCRQHGGDERLANRIALCIEEMATNVIKHGFTQDGKQHHLSIRILNKPEYWVLRFRDDCGAFDPVHYVPDEKSDALGIRLVLAMAEEANYTYSLNLNNLTLKLPKV
ncbi:MAG: ATP-binding protein [Clostridia bacterium]|nr:ATP-binding protein [Clostridia bacterium]